MSPAATYNGTPPSDSPNRLVIRQVISRARYSPRSYEIGNIHDVGRRTQHCDVTVEVPTIEVRVNRDGTKRMNGTACVGPCGADTGLPSVHCMTTGRRQ